MPTSTPSAVKTILLAGIIAGTLDVSTALTVYTLILQKVGAIPLLQGIASGVFGSRAFSGGLPMALAGLGFHYIIAFCFTIFYFLVFPYIPFLRRHRIASGLLYGVLVWAVMNLVVLPLSNVHQSRITLSGALIGAGILMLMIGLPISLIIHNYYTRKGA